MSRVAYRHDLSAMAFATALRIHHLALGLCGKLPHHWATVPLWWAIALASLALSLPFYALSYVLSRHVAWLCGDAVDEARRRAKEAQR